jgi:hypothetical protein
VIVEKKDRRIHKNQENRYQDLMKAVQSTRTGAKAWIGLVSTLGREAKPGLFLGKRDRRDLESTSLWRC